MSDITKLLIEIEKLEKDNKILLEENTKAWKIAKDTQKQNKRLQKTVEEAIIALRYCGTDSLIFKWEELLEGGEDCGKLVSKKPL